MSGRITGMLWICKERGDGWIRLAGPQLEVCVFATPAGQGGVMLGDRLIGIRSGGTWCVEVQMILEDLQIDLLKPGLEKSGLPEPGQVIRAVGSAQILDCRILHVGDIGSGYGRRTRTEIL